MAADTDRVEVGLAEAQWTAGWPALVQNWYSSSAATAKAASRPAKSTALRQEVVVHRDLRKIQVATGTVVVLRAVPAVAEDKVAARVWGADRVEVAAAPADTAVALRAIPAVAEDRVAPISGVKVVPGALVVEAAVVVVVLHRAIPVVVTHEVGQEAGVAVKIRAAEPAEVVVAVEPAL